MVTILMLGPGRNMRGGISAVVNVYFDSELIDKYKITYITTHVDGSKAVKLFQFIKAFFRFSGLILKGEIGLVHIHSASRASFYRKSLFALFAKTFRKKIVFHIHGAEFKKFYFEKSGELKKRFIRYVLGQADRIIALSDEWKRILTDIVGRGDRICMIYNPVKVRDVIPSIRNSSLVSVLLMGRLEKRKGVFDLIDIAHKLKDSQRKVKLILCGDGDVDKVMDEIRKKNLAPFFEVPGWITDKDKYYKQADIYVLPSYAEGLPMSILEAASYGLPIVATRVGGIPEIIDDGVNGFLIDPGDKGALTDRLLRLIENPELRSQMGRAAYQKVKDKFDVDTVVKQLDSLYQEFLN